MPELPDITLYVEALEQRLLGETLEHIRIASPFVLRSVIPAVDQLEAKRLIGVSRLGKRIVIELEQAFFIVIHLMIAGRLWWEKPGIAIPKGKGLAAFDFARGSLLFTEVSKKKRASIHLMSGRQQLREFDRGGLEVLNASEGDFMAALLRENHTLKRALTDPRIFSGIGNAYSDEILFAAQLSPFKQTRSLADAEQQRLFHAVQNTLKHWTEKLRAQLDGEFPQKVTAFHEDMAVHGRYKKPCGLCGKPIQRIVYAENESNYCANCQTGGRLLADRALSRLLKDNWPKRIEDLE